MERYAEGIGVNQQCQCCGWNSTRSKTSQSFAKSEVETSLIVFGSSFCVIVFTHFSCPRRAKLISSYSSTTIQFPPLYLPSDTAVSYGNSESVTAHVSTISPPLPSNLSTFLF